MVVMQCVSCHCIIANDMLNMNKKYLESRMKWARSHNKQYQHKYNTRVRNRDTSSQERYQFYRSKQWQSLRKQALERDHYLPVLPG